MGSGPIIWNAANITLAILTVIPWILLAVALKGADNGKRP